jgi:hypothetical protein
MKTKKPPQPPLKPLLGPPRCPVCGHVAYSAAGIHPQCALKRGDSELKEAQLAMAPAVALKPKKTPWSKPTPK